VDGGESRCSRRHVLRLLTACWIEMPPAIHGRTETDAGHSVQPDGATERETRVIEVWTPGLAVRSSEFPRKTGRRRPPGEREYERTSRPPGCGPRRSVPGDEQQKMPSASRATQGRGRGQLEGATSRWSVASIEGCAQVGWRAA